LKIEPEHLGQTSNRGTFKLMPFLIKKCIKTRLIFVTKIVFFRIQYRVIKPKKSPWQTDETEIQGDHRQYEVKNLVPGITNILLTRLMIRTKMYKYRDGRFCRTDCPSLGTTVQFNLTEVSDN
jgi:hypothetical protein